MSSAWSWFVIVIVALNIVGCVWLLWWTGKRRPGDPSPTDTSHVWDGDITEYNKPMPRWWINLFYLTILFGIAYLVWYPGLGAFAGTSRWTSAKQHEADKAAQDKKLAATFAPYEGKSIDAIARDPKALQLGRAIFSNTCATCHGSSARGAFGYPNLTDHIWHWGGAPDRILETVLNGREGVMPPWGPTLEGIGGRNAVLSVATYVRSLSEPALAKDYFAAQGKPLYDSICVACHGADGKGNAQLGSPDLTDDYWMYGNSTEQLIQTIGQGRRGVMPAHGPILGETRARLAAAYVWSLSNPASASAKTNAASASGTAKQ